MIDQSPSQRSLADVLRGMEEDTRDLVAWADAVSSMGTVGFLIEPSQIYVMGNAMLEVAKRLRDDWEEAHGLAVPGSTLGRAKPCA